MGLEVTHPEIQQMANTVERWLAQFVKAERKTEKMLIVAGPTGTGKTHVARNIKRLAGRLAFPIWESGQWSHPPRVQLFEWARVVFMEYRNFTEWMEEVEEADMLFLEDVGAEVDRFKSAEPTERLREVLNLFENKWLFITTNLMPEQWPIKWDDRVSDRLFRNSKIVTLRKTPRFTNHTT